MGVLVGFNLFVHLHAVLGHLILDLLLNDLLATSQVVLVLLHVFIFSGKAGYFPL